MAGSPGWRDIRAYRLFWWRVPIAGAGGAAPPSRHVVPPRPGLALDYLGASVYPALSLAIPGDTLRFGSVSGLAFDAATGEWVGAMDAGSGPAWRGSTFGGAGRPR